MAGISNATLQQGWNTRTTDEPISYNRWASPGNVQILDPNTGSPRNLMPGETVPAGSTVGIYTSQAGTVTGSPVSATGGQVLTGTQIPLDAETIRHSQDVDRLTQRGQDISHSDNMAQIAASQAASAQRHEEAMANYALQGAIAQQQYQIDLAKYGLDVANFNYLKRKDAADMELKKVEFGLQASGFELSQNQFNASQAQAKEQARENILKMLADRRGPQDYVAYNNLLNGLDAPTPERTGVVDPFAGLDDLYKPSTLKPPEMPDFNLDTSPYAGAPPSQINLPSFPSGGGFAGGGFAGGGGGATSGGGFNAGDTGLLDSYPINRNVGGLGSLPYGNDNRSQPVSTAPNDFNTGIGGTRPSDVMPPSAAPIPQSPAAAFAQRTPEQQSMRDRLLAGLPLMHGGGMTDAAAIVGDKPGRATGAEEIAMATTGPDGQPVLRVIPHDRVQELLAMLGGQSGGSTQTNLLNLPHAASGGTYGTANQGNTITTNTYSPFDLGNQPFFRKLTGSMPTRAFGQFGATLSNPAQGLNNVPFNISLQRYNQLFPSEQAQAGSLYEQGLGVNMDDVLAAARRSAPEGRGRVSLGSSISPSIYGS